MSKVETSGAVIVSWDFSHGDDNDILIVGKQGRHMTVDVINAFRGEEAHIIFNKLTSVKNEHSPK